MRDHFILLVDRLLTESTLEAVIERRIHVTPLVVDATISESSSHKMNIGGDGLSPGKLVECRICQDEDLVRNMETPCVCRGSLKYAHRRCVQKWCNEKGDTICEICHQPFRPAYTAPPRLFLAAVSSDRNIFDPDYEDYNFSFHTTRSVTCCRTIAIIFMFLLILRHILPMIIGGYEEGYSFSVFMLLLLRTAGILLPMYVMVKAVTAIRRRCQNSPSRTAPEEDENEHMQTWPQIIPV